ncbi:MAG: hypothetical protein H6509_16050 [Bryobacterales bacterium]|nr:hypothetical protein [Bryobacterales bacterium]
MKKTEIKKILKQQLPGYEVVEELAATAGAEAVTAQPAVRAVRADSERENRIEDLRKRFLGAQAAVAKTADAVAAPETTTVLVKPIGKDAPPKAVIIEKGRIVARQG